MAQSVKRLPSARVTIPRRAPCSALLTRALFQINKTLNKQQQQCGSPPLTLWQLSKEIATPFMNREPNKRRSSNQRLFKGSFLKATSVVACQISEYLPCLSHRGIMKIN